MHDMGRSQISVLTKRSQEKKNGIIEIPLL